MYLAFTVGEEGGGSVKCGWDRGRLRRDFGIFGTLLCLVGLVVCLCPAVAEARRFGLFIGNNRGFPSEPELRFAERDALRIASILRQHGGLEDEDTVLMMGRSAEAVEAALVSLNERIRKASDPDTMLIVYYSGHADADSLHLGDDRLTIERVRSLASGSAALFRVLLLDACRNLSVERTKGASVAEAFKLEIDERLTSEGFALIRSSAPNEPSQESDRISGSFFTHYFSSALLGAGDISGDLKVSLEEAYAYAYRATIAATSQTLAGTQHPTFEYDFHGHGALVMTDLSPSDARTGTLVVPGGVHVVVMKAGEEQAFAEVLPRAQESRIRVPTGRYVVRLRRADHYREGEVDVGGGQIKAVSESALSEVGYARLVRKGASATLRRSYSVVAGVGAQTPVLAGYPVAPSASLALLTDLPSLSVGGRFGFARSGTRNARLDSSMTEASLDVLVRHVVDWHRLSAWFGGALGLSLNHQVFEPERLAPGRLGLGGRLLGEAGVSFECSLGWRVGVETSAGASLLSVSSEDRTSVVRPEGRAGLLVSREF